VPGKARLLNGDVWHYDTSARQSPDPARRRRRRVADVKGVAAMCAWICDTGPNGMFPKKHSMKPCLNLCAKQVLSRTEQYVL
jgi:hypothetical protein